MKYCDQCGTKLKENAKFCSNCGACLSETNKCCLNCGEELEPGAKFCSNCGQAVAERVFTEQTAKNDYQSHLQLNFPIVIKLVSMYEGNSIIYKSSGTVECYKDKIIYTIKTGGPMLAGLGLAGMAISAKMAKKDGNTIEYNFSDLTQIVKSSQSFGSAITLFGKDGNNIKLAGMSSSFDQIVAAFNDYKNCR